MPIRLHQHQRLHIRRQPDLRVILHAPHCHLVQKLQSARYDLRRNDRRNGLRCRPHRIIKRQHRPPRRRLRHQFQNHLRDDPQRPLAPHKKILHRIPSHILHTLVPQPRHRPIRQHHPNRHHIVPRHPILQTPQPPTVLSHITSDRRNLHRPWIRRIKKPHSLGRIVNRLRDHPALRMQRQILLIHLHDPIHLRHTQHHTSLNRHTPPAQPRPRPPRHHRHPPLPRQTHAPRHLLRRMRKNHRSRPRFQRCRPIKPIRNHILLLHQDMLLPHDSPQSLHQAQINDISHPQHSKQSSQRSIPETRPTKFATLKIQQRPRRRCFERRGQTAQCSTARKASPTQPMPTSTRSRSSPKNRSVDGCPSTSAPKFKLFHPSTSSSLQKHFSHSIFYEY